MLLSFALLLPLAPVCLQTPEAGVPEERVESGEAIAVLDRLIERTNALRSFVAEYRTNSKDGPDRLRLVYLAPGMGWIHAEKDGVSSCLGSVEDGVLNIDVDKGDGLRVVARVDMGGMMACYENAEDQIRSILGVADRRPARATSLSFMMRPGPPSDDGRPGLTMSLGMSKESVLGWLTDLRNEPATRIEGDRLLLERPDGLILEISSRTGFVERIVKPSSDEPGFLLESLRENVELGPSDIATPGALDEQVEVDREMEERIRSAMRSTASRWMRSRMYRNLADTVRSERGSLSPSVRDAARSAFRAVHACDLPGWLEGWIERTRTDAEKRADAMAGQRDNFPRETLEGMAERWVDKVREHLDTARSSFVSRIELPGVEGDAAFLAEVLEVERQAGAEAFDERVSEPLLRYLDELVEEALDG
jgi:hypothetical protein